MQLGSCKPTATPRVQFKAHLENRKQIMGIGWDHGDGMGWGWVGWDVKGQGRIGYIVIGSVRTDTEM